MSTEIVINQNLSIQGFQDYPKLENLNWQILCYRWFSFVLLQGTAMMSVPSAWMNMKKETNSESCPVHTVSLVFQKT